jgi:hypothetical protein
MYNLLLVSCDGDPANERSRGRVQALAGFPVQALNDGPGVDVHGGRARAGDSDYRGSQRVRSRGRLVFSGCARAGASFPVGALARAPRFQWVCSRGRLGIQGVSAGALARAPRSPCSFREEGEAAQGGARRRPRPKPRRRRAPPLARAPRPSLPAFVPGGVPARIRADPARLPPRGPRGVEPRRGHEKSRRIGLTLSRS